MKHLALLAAILLAAATASAQNLKITALELSSEPVAKVDFPVDLNGNKCGLVEVALTADGVAFEGNVIGTPTHEGGVYRIFMTPGTRFLNIKYPGSEPVLVNFRDYKVDKLLSQSLLTIKAEEPQHDIAAQLDSNIGEVSDEAEMLYQQGAELMGATKLSKAYEAFRKAHELGHPKATYQLGFIYTDPFRASRNPIVEKMSGIHFEDNPVPKDLTMAAKLYEQSAEAGYVLAQFAIGECYEKGKGVKKNKEKAMEWYARAAEQGNLEAQAKLGKKVKANKIGNVVVSYQVADMQFIPSAISSNPTDLSAATQGRTDGNGQACALVKVMLPFENVSFSGDIVGDTPFKTNEYWVYMPQGSKELTISYPDIEPVRVRFVELGIDQLEGKNTYSLHLSFPIDLLSSGVQFSGEDCYLTALGYQERKDDRFILWMQRGAELKNPKCMAFLGNLHLYGTLVKKDVSHGVSMLEEASALGCGEASYYLGMYYMLLGKNPKLGQQLLDKANEQGFQGPSM